MIETIITSSVLIIILILLRALLKGKISPGLQYSLWVLVLLRLCLPFPLFASPISVMNAVPEMEAAVYETAGESFEEDQSIIVINTKDPEKNFIAKPEEKNDAPILSASDIAFFGSAVIGGNFIISGLLFYFRLKKCRKAEETEISNLPVFSAENIKAPCLFGLFRPGIYVTGEVLENPKMFRHAVEHETTHYYHCDNFWAVLRCLCVAVYWYNPLVWAAAYLSAKDSELACDESTIKRLGESERFDYGRTLISLSCEKGRFGAFSAVSGMGGSKKSIKERVVFIAKKPKTIWITAVLVAVVTVFAVGCTFTGAEKPKLPEVITPQEETENAENEEAVHASLISWKAKKTEDYTDINYENVTGEIAYQQKIIDTGGPAYGAVGLEFYEEWKEKYGDFSNQHIVMRYSHESEYEPRELTLAEVNIILNYISELEPEQRGNLESVPNGNAFFSIFGYDSEGNELWRMRLSGNAMYFGLEGRKEGASYNIARQIDDNILWKLIRNIE